MRKTEQKYFAADAEAVEERARLRDLEEMLDAWTIERMTALGVDAGWRCLEVGAGGGSIAEWMSARVGEKGNVVATDIDPRFLDEVDARSNVEVRRHDITCDDLEEGAFDFAHCRAVVMHLPDPDAAIGRMIRALRPGGVLLVEDPDFSLVGAVDVTHPGAAHVERTFLGAARTIRDAGLMDPYFGRTLPARLRAAGIVDTGNQVTATMSLPHNSASRLGKVTMLRLRAPVVALGGCTEADYDVFLEAFDDPTLEMFSPLIVQAWGRRP